MLPGDSMLPATRRVLTAVTNTINKPTSGFVLKEGEVDIVSGSFLLTALIEWRYPDHMEFLSFRARALQTELEMFLRNSGIRIRLVVMGQEL